MTRNWATAAAAARLPPSTNSGGNERLPVGLRPVTQQQLEARHLRRTASAPPDTHTSAPSTQNSALSEKTPRAPPAADDNDDDEDNGEWKSVESKSRWHRSHRRGVLPPASTPLVNARAAALSAEPLRPPAPPKTSSHYAWATTSVVSASSSGAVGTAVAREETLRGFAFKPPTAAASRGVGAGSPPHRTPTLRSRSFEQSAVVGGGGRTSFRSAVRRPLPAALGDVRFSRNTSLQQLLTKIEAVSVDVEQQQQQQQQYHHQAARRRSDHSGQLTSPATLGEYQRAVPVAVVSDAAPQPPAAQKCGDKRDFFFRNLDFETRSRLQIDDVAGFSVTEHETATKISEAVMDLFEGAGPLSRHRSSLVVTDATACVGGNVMSFCDYFAIVNAVECDGTRCEMLAHNLAVLNKRNAICIHASYLLVLHDLQQDVVFIDPPWGGPEYKDLAKVDLFLDDTPLYDVCTQLYGRTQVVALKVPTNFDADKFAEHVPGRVSVRKDFHKMHLVVIDFRETPADRPL